MPNGQNERQTSKMVSSRQSQLATVLIGILVVIAGFLTYNYFKKTRVEPTEKKEEVQLEEESLGEISEAGEEQGLVTGTYTVEKGDTLWKIAESQLGSGERWQEIAEANNIPVDNPEVEVGEVLNIPGGVLAEVIEQTPTSSVEPTPTPEEEEIIEEVPETAAEQRTYLVKHGDTLWGIAKEMYGDGARWQEIFNANPLSMYNPNGHEFPLIHAGNVLVIP